jgi:hypothetical protein
MREHVGKLAQWTEKARAYKAAYKWIQETVDPSVYQGAVRECENEQARMEKEQLTEMIDGDPQSKSWTLQLLLRILKRDYAPSETSARTLAQSTYRKKLAVVKAGRVNPKEWLQEWRAAYQDALLYDLPDVKGPLAVLDFIKAVQEKLAPEWARERHSELLRDDALGVANQYSLLDYVNWLSALNEESLTASGQQKTVGLYATLGGRSDAPATPPVQRNQSPNTRANTCPCKHRFHRHKAINCHRLRYCYDGSTASNLRNLPSVEEIKETRLRLESDFPDLRREIAKLSGNMLPIAQLASGPPSGNSFSTQAPAAPVAPKPTAPAKARYPGNVQACLISPEFLDEALAAAGVYATMDMNRHPLAESTLLDNGAATHLVNSEALLVPGSFIKSTADDSVEAGTSSLMIKGRGTRVFKGALHGPNGPNTGDLTLSNVAVVEGFNVNIISEARLLQAGVWYNGLDCTLRTGTAEDSLVLK